MSKVKTNNCVLLKNELSLKINTLSCSLTILSKEIYSYLGFQKYQSCRVYLDFVQRGFIYGTTSANPLKIKQQLERLSKLLYSLEIAQEDVLIKTLRKEALGFNYPPLDKNKFLYQSKEKTEMYRKLGLLNEENYKTIETLVHTLFSEQTE